jgi:hypothetical protein
VSTQGFASIPNWLVDDESFTAHDKLVYMVLSRHVDEHGSAFPGIEHVARKAGISPASVKRAKKRLIDAGLVSVEERRSHKRGRDRDEPSTDIVIVHNSRPRKPRPVDNPPTPRGQGDPSPRGRGQRDPRGGVTVSPGLGSQGAPNKTQENKTQEKVKTRVVGGDTPSPVEPVDNFAPLEPLARPERCVDHQHEAVPPSCGKCKDARLTLELVEREIEVRPLKRCEHGYVEAHCPYCPGGALFHLEDAG